MNKEKKKEIKDFIIVLLGYLCFVCFCLYFDVNDFVKYKMNSERYQVLKVKIEDTVIRPGGDRNTAYFYYYDNDERKRGVTKLNYNERKGDYIDVAFDDNMHYVRTQITVSSNELWDWVLIIIIGIGLLYIGYKTFKKE